MRRAIIKLTDACQMRCIYCVNADGGGKLARIPFQTLKDILAKFKPYEIEFTGGEPSYYFPSLLQAIKEAKKYSSFILVNSNLELLDEDKIHQLEQAGLSHIHFAIHALDPKVHRLVRGNPNADLNKVLKNVEYILQETQLKVIFEFVLMKSNLDELPKVYQYIVNLQHKYKDRIIGLEMQRLIPRGRASIKLAPSLEQQIKIIESLEKPKFLVETFCFGKRTSDRLLKKGFQIYPCDAGEKMFYFDITGKVLADNFSGYIISQSYKKFDPITNDKIRSFHCPFKGN